MTKKMYFVWNAKSKREYGWSVEAISAKDACEDWADSDDAYQDTFEIANGRNATVCVVEEGSTLPPEEYVVEGEMLCTYRARPKHERDTSNDLHGGDAQ